MPTTRRLRTGCIDISTPPPATKFEVGAGKEWFLTHLTFIDFTASFLVW